MHQFALPPTLAEDEFKNVWSTVENDLKAQGRTFADEGTTEEKAREEYRGIAERRVGGRPLPAGNRGEEKKTGHQRGRARPVAHPRPHDPPPRTGNLGAAPRKTRLVP